MTSRDQRQARIDAMARMGPVKDVLFDFDDMESLARIRSAAPPAPPLPPEAPRGYNNPMNPEDGLASRVSRLEMGFCAAFVLIFAAIIASYLLVAERLDKGREDVATLNVALAEIRGDMKVAAERASQTDRKIDAIASKVGAK